MWSLDVSCCEDETTALFQQGSNKELYEAITVAKFSRDESVSCPIVIVKRSINNTVVVADYHVSVFKDTHEICLSIELESLVECLAITDDSKLLIIGEESGHLSIHHIDSQRRLIRKELTQPIEGKGSFSKIICYQNRDFVEVAILTVRGKLNYFKKIDLEALKSAIEQQKWGDVKNILSRHEFLCLDLAPLYENSVAKGLFYSHSQSSLNCYGSGQYIFGLDIKDTVDDFVYQFEPYDEIKKAIFSYDGRYVFAIDNKGNFFTLCGKTFTLIKTWNPKSIVDITLLESTLENGNNVSQCKLVFLLKKLDSDGYQIIFKDFPSLEICYKVSVSNFCRLADPVVNQDEVYFVEGVSSKISDKIDSLKIRVISEAHPQMRLEKLIQKLKFDEAESFARQFNLDLESVFKPHSNFLASNEVTPAVIVKIEQILTNIKDGKFILDFGLQIRLATSDLTKKILTICVKILRTFPKDDAAKYLKPILQNQEKLNTFLLLFPDAKNWPTWYIFSKKTIPNIFLSFLKSGEIDQALFLWNCHYNEILSEESPDFVKTVLDCIPDQVKSSDIIIWMKEHFLQPVLIRFPDLVECVSNWVVKTAKLYEVTEKSGWPSNSVKLLSIFTEICSEVTRSHRRVPISAKCINSSVKGELRELNVLRKFFKELEILRSKFSCYISFTQYAQSDKTLVAFIILDLLVKGNNLERGIRDFLSDFFKDNDLRYNDVLLGYIEDSIRSQCVPWWYHDEAPWEYPVFQVLPFIRKPQLRARATKLVLGQAPIPWSDAVKKLALNCQFEDTHLKKDVESLIQRATLKRILIKYNLTKFNLHSQEKAYSLMFFILTQANADVLSDALEVVKCYPNLCRGDCYLRYAGILLERRCISELLDFYMDLDEAEALDAGGRIMNFCEIVLQDPKIKMMIGDYQYLNNAAFVAKHISSRLIKIKPQDVDFKLRFDLANQIYNLQMEFNLFDNMNAAFNNSDKWKVFFTIANQEKHDFYQGSICTDRKINVENLERTLVESLTRLGDILNLPKVLVCGHIIEKLVFRKELDQAKLLFQELMISNCPTELVLNLLKRLLTNEKLFASDSVSVIVNDLHAVSCKVLLDCREHLLMECIHLCQWTSALVSLYSLDARFSLRQGQGAQNKYNVWKFSKIYRDQGMNVSVKDILPNFLECLGVSCFSPQKMNLTMILHLFSLSRQIMLKLRSRAQNEMALSLFVFLQSSFIGRALDNQLDHANHEEERALIDANSEFKGALKEVCFTLITRVISQKHCDYSAGLNVLTLLNQDTALIVIKNLAQRYAKDHCRLKSLSIICLKYAMDVKNQGLTDKIFLLYRNSSWLEELDNLKINCKSGLNEDSIPQILQDLTECPNVELRQLAQFCKDFSKNKDQVFCYYFLHLIQSDIVQLFGLHHQPNELDIDQLNKLLEKCDALAKSILHNQSFTEILIEIFPKVNSYCYEALKFICQTVIKCSCGSELTVPRVWERNLKLLQFLELYVRVNHPTEFETEKWTNDHPDFTDLPAISSVRLPYHLLANANDRILKIIDPELYPENIEEWLLVASIFNLNANMLKIRSIKNYVLKWFNTQPKGELLLTQPTDVEFVERVAKLLEEVTEMDLIIHLVSWIIKTLPLCETKVELTSSLAEHGEKMNEKSDNIQIRKCATDCRTFYEKFSLEIILRKYEMFQPRYFDLLENPRDLMSAILEDKLKGDVFGPVEKKVLTVVSHIARSRNCQVDDVYSSLLSTWMPWAKMDSLLDDTFTLNLNQMALNFADTTQEIWTDNLKRTINLLQEIDASPSILEHLKSFTYENVSSVQRIQAIICFLVAFDEFEIEKTMNRSREELREYLSDLIFVAQLEELQLPYPLEVFQEWNKIDLVKNVLSFGSQNPKALAFASSLCIRENIWDDSVWESIFGHLASLHLNEELKRLLEQINHEPSFWISQSYIKAWAFVINNKIEQCGSEEETCSIYSLIYKTKCVSSLNLIKMAKNLSRHGTIPALAIALLDPQNKTIAKELLKKRGVQKVLTEYKTLMKVLPGHKRAEYLTVEVLLQELI